MLLSYRIGLNDYETDDDFAQGENDYTFIILWLINTVLNYVILLNMLIAVMEDSFERVLESDELIVYEKAHYVNLYHYLISSWKLAKYKHIIVIEAEQANKQMDDKW